MKEKELKALIKEVVRECVREAGPQVPKGALAKLNPKIASKASSAPMKKGVAPLPPPVKKANEAGLTSEEPEVGLEIPMGGADIAVSDANAEIDGVAGAECPCPDGEGYDEGEEVKLMKLLHLVTKKLLRMHGESDALPGEPPIKLPTEKPEGGSKSDGGEKKKSSGDSEEKSEKKDKKDKKDSGEKKEKKPKKEKTDEGYEAGPQYKVRTANAQLETPGQENHARDIANEPEVNECKSPRRQLLDKMFKRRLQETKQIAEFLLEEYGAGPQYKVRTSDAQLETPGEENHARDIANEPKVNEASYKVQKRSQTDVNDTPSNPHNVQDPDVPMS